jgi:transcription elongation factor GreA-like protein/transcription elongation GreA/GreB family factor
MGYLNEFNTQIANRDFQKFLQLWEEYCTCDAADYIELSTLLQTIKQSDFAKPFGNYVEQIIPQWETLQNADESYEILKLILDLQTTNSQKLAEIAQKMIEARHSEVDHLNEKLRLIGLRTKDQFQNALSNFDLLIHGTKGNFVFHASGWGAGEIMDVSPIRELYMIEFENVTGIKQITFTNAFKSLSPLPKGHFLARRFADPDKLEKEAKENPVEVVKCLLRDLGPKTGSEIKDELCELVIPEPEWQKWWQNTRTKLKKDTEIEAPENLKEPFALRKAAISHDVQFLDSLKKKKNDRALLDACYAFVRDHAGHLKNKDVQTEIQKALEGILARNPHADALLLETYLCLDAVSNGNHEKEILAILKTHNQLEDLINSMDIAAYKKHALLIVKKSRADWQEQFARLLPKLSLGLLRDYLIKELLQEKRSDLIVALLKNLLHRPSDEPEFFFWYFQKLMSGEKDFPLSSKQDILAFAEGCLTLLHAIENNTEHKDLIKRIYMFLTSKRYTVVRELLNESPLTFAKEFLLLASKCHSFTTTDIKSLNALAAVVHPGLNALEKKRKVDLHTFWTTEKGLQAVQDKLKHIATKEVIENSREVEAARALGDLRENSEYKAAVEKRARLQGELKTLSEQLSKARVITADDIVPEEAGVGTIVTVEDSQGKTTTYTILGPWEANADKNILSSHSKFAQALDGLHVDDRFTFKDEEYSIKSIQTIFD